MLPNSYRAHMLRFLPLLLHAYRPLQQITFSADQLEKLCLRRKLRPALQQRAN